MNCLPAAGLVTLIIAHPLQSAMPAAPEPGQAHVAWASTKADGGARKSVRPRAAGTDPGAADFFISTGPTPTVAGLSPTSGINTGGTILTITGSGFTGASRVTIGGTAATALTVINDAKLTCVTPAHSAGTAGVIITTPCGVVLADTLFTYGLQNSAPSFTLLDGANLSAGVIWTPLPGAGTRNWLPIACSADGTKLAAAASSDKIYTSTDFGESWTARDSNRFWHSIASSADGTKLAAVVFNGLIYTSTDSGVSWTPRNTRLAWWSIASSTDGTKLAAAPEFGAIQTSTDSGVTWTSRPSPVDARTIISSADGTKLAAAGLSGRIYTSADSGGTWTPRGTNGHSYSLACSADGIKLVAAAYGGWIQTSTDAGTTWTTHPSAGSYNWNSLASSADGRKLAAAAFGGKIYTSADFGVNWTARDSNRNWYSIAMSTDGTKMAATVYGGQIYTSTITPCVLTVAASGGRVTTANFIRNISPGPASDSAQTVGFTVTNNSQALFSSQPAISPGGTLTFTPKTTASGTAVVTVFAYDTGGTAFGGVDKSAPQTFSIIIGQFNHLEVWRLANYDTVSNTGVAADTASPRGDGLANLLKFAMGMDPKVPGVSPARVASNDGTLEFTYPRSLDAIGEASFIVEWSESLLADSWSTEGVTEVVVGTVGNIQQVKASLPEGSGGHRYVRLRVTVP